MTYRTRKEQIEKDFLTKLMRDLRALGYPLNRKARALIREELRGAAMVAAAEERNRTLEILRASTAHPMIVENEIISRGVLDVLGYE